MNKMDRIFQCILLILLLTGNYKQCTTLSFECRKSNKYVKNINSNVLCY